MTNEEIIEANSLTIFDLLIYSETSKTGLLWDIKKRNEYGLDSNSILTSHAGSMNGQGYYYVNFLYKNYKAHRLIYEMFNGKLPSGYFIDHIDGNKGSNRKENLRAVTRELNARNLAMSSRNKSGINCVRRNKTTAKGVDYWSWQCYWKNLDGKMSAKSFSINKYGDELAEHLAREYRLHQIYLLNLMGAGYTERHGN